MTQLDPIDISWYEHASCKGYPTEWWFPTHGMTAIERVNTKKAKAICFVCPVKGECFKVGTQSHSSGIWGGKTLYNGRDNQRRSKKQK